MPDEKQTYSTDKKENDKIINLLDTLKSCEEKLREALTAEKSFITIATLEKGYKSTAKELNSLFAKLGIDKTVPENYLSEKERAKKNFSYRGNEGVTKNTGISESKDQVSQETPIESTPVRSIQKSKEFDVGLLDFDKLNLSDSTLKPTASSTPNVSEPKELHAAKFDTPKHCFHYIKQEITKEIPPSYVESFLENEQNYTDLVRTVTGGFRLPNIYQIVKNKILGFVQKQEEELANQTKEETPLLTALDNLPEYTTIGKMPNTLDMRGLSVKDALDLIPRYNGANIPLSQFLDGCNEASSILPTGMEENFMKFVRIRLYGEALNIARSQSFTTFKQLAEFFERMFGSAKTYYDLTGELAKIKQGRNETVVIFLNRLKEIEKEIKKAAQKEGRITDETAFDTELSKDCLKYFMRGLRWEIKARMGTPATYQKAQEEAIETEREYACSIFNDPTEKEKSEEKPRTIKETRRVNIVAPQPQDFTCWYCNKPGHTISRCFARERDGQAWRTPGSFNRPRFFAPPPPQQTWGWNAENRRVGFLPEQMSPARGFTPPQNRGNSQPIGNPPRIFNRGPVQNGNTARDNLSRNRGGNLNNGGRVNPEPRNQPALNCYFCGRTGHMQRDCYSYQRAASQTQTRQENSTDLSPAGAVRGTPTTTHPQIPPRENVPRPSVNKNA